MTEGLNIRFAGALQQFILDRVGSSGLYTSPSEYLSDLVRRDYEQEERKWSWLREELKSGAEAEASQFIPLDADALLAKAKSRRNPNAG